MEFAGREILSQPEETTKTEHQIYSKGYDKQRAPTFSYSFIPSDRNRQALFLTDMKDIIGNKQAGTANQTIPCPLCRSELNEPVISSATQMHAQKRLFSFVRCTACDYVYLNPPVPPDTIGAYYEESYLPYRGAEAWGKYAHLAEKGEQALDKKRARLAMKHFKQKPLEHCLDVGCGKPTFLKKLKEETACEAWGLDFKVEGWKSSPAFSDLRLLEGEVRDLASRKDLPCFDLITMWHYLEHDYNPLSTLRSLKKIAHPETRLIIEVPDYDSISRKLQGSFWAGYHTPRHISLFNRQSLSRLLDKSGWQVIQEKKNGTMSPYALWWLGRMEKKEADWSQSLEPYFPGFLAGYLLSSPLIYLTRPWLRLGVQLVIAKAS